MYKRTTDDNIGHYQHENSDENVTSNETECPTIPPDGADPILDHSESGIC